MTKRNITYREAYIKTLKEAIRYYKNQMAVFDKMLKVTEEMLETYGKTKATDSIN